MAAAALRTVGLEIGLVWEIRLKDLKPSRGNLQTEGRRFRFPAKDNAR